MQRPAGQPSSMYPAHLQSEQCIVRQNLPGEQRALSNVLLTQRGSLAAHSRPAPLEVKEAG